jgi:hypothetical protein
MAEECFDYIFFSFLLLFILSLLSLFGLLVSLFYASYSSIQDRSPNDLDIFWGFVCLFPIEAPKGEARSKSDRNNPQTKGKEKGKKRGKKKTIIVLCFF